MIPQTNSITAKTNILHRNHNLFLFMDREEILESIRKIPMRMKTVEKLKKDAENLISTLMKTYMENARKSVEGIPSAYVRFTSTFVIRKTSVRPVIVLPLPEPTPAVALNSIPLEDGSSKRVSFEIHYMRADAEKISEDGLVVELSCSNDILESLDRISELTNSSKGRGEICVQLISNPGSEEEKEEIREINRVIDQGFEKGEKAIRSWLTDISEYADGNSLFGALL